MDLITGITGTHKMKLILWYIVITKKNMTHFPGDYIIPAWLRNGSFIQRNFANTKRHTFCKKDDTYCAASVWDLNKIFVDLDLLWTSYFQLHKSISITLSRSFFSFEYKKRVHIYTLKYISDIRSPVFMRVISTKVTKKSFVCESARIFAKQSIPVSTLQTHLSIYTLCQPSSPLKASMINLTYFIWIQNNTSVWKWETRKIL